MGKQNIYDNENFFDYFREIREREANYNDLIETPIVLEMLPDLKGKKVLDIGCGMGQHAKQYADLGAERILGIDISERMLEFAKQNFSSDRIAYRVMAMEDIEQINEKFDVVTSSLAFDYAEDLQKLFNDIYKLLEQGGELIFSMSHPVTTSFTGEYPRWTKDDKGKKLYANLENYDFEGKRRITWVVEEYEFYHRKVSTIINDLIKAGFAIKECRESTASDALVKRYHNLFDGLRHKPDFIFFKCGK